MAYLSIQNVSKHFDQPVLQDVSLEIEKGEVVALLGPSGSGKTTLLRIVAGFETPDQGSIIVDNQDITAQTPASRRCGMVFQHYALFPHLSVGENVAFGLAGRSRSEVDTRVEEMLQVVGLDGLAARGVDQISGGQQQRVALARALAPSPRVLLLDEPLSNLDPELRERTRRQLREIVRATGITTLIVTHEQEEAFHIADRTAVLGTGRLRQIGRAEELYYQPADRFVARFVGRGSEVPATPDKNSPSGWALGWQPSVMPTTVRILDAQTPNRAWIRPESLAIGPIGAKGWGGMVVEIRWHPRSTVVTVELSTGAEIEAAAESRLAESLSLGDKVSVNWRAQGPEALLFEVDS